jgi:predicted RNA-binding Zn ribbon-like protein
MPYGNKSFDWSGGHPALDLVNTLDERPSTEPVETLATYDDLVRFTELAGLIDGATAKHLRRLAKPTSARVAKHARELRERLHDVLASAHRQQSAPQGALKILTATIREAHAAQTLAPSTGPSLARQGWDLPVAVDLPLHVWALAIEDLLVRADRCRIRKCNASDCDVYFIDTSKGHRRQWCSMRNCGNREKQRRWRSEER